MNSLASPITARLRARSNALSLAFSRSIAQRIRARLLMRPPRRTIRRGLVIDDVWRRNVNLGPQCAMDGTHLRDLEQSCSLLCTQISSELQRPVHTVEPPCFRLARRAVCRMDSGML